MKTRTIIATLLLLGLAACGGSGQACGCSDLRVVAEHISGKHDAQAISRFFCRHVDLGKIGQPVACASRAEACASRLLDQLSDFFLGHCCRDWGHRRGHRRGCWGHWDFWGYRCYLWHCCGYWRRFWGYCCAHWGGWCCWSFWCAACYALHTLLYRLDDRRCYALQNLPYWASCASH